MPRYPKSKYQALSPSKQQALQKAGVTIYDDSGGAGGSEHQTHENAYGGQSTSIDPRKKTPAEMTPPPMNLPANVGNAEKEEFSDSYRKYMDWLKKSRREVAGIAAGIATSEFTAPALGAMAGSVAAGRALKHAPKAIRLGAKWLARPAGEAAGQGAGEYVNQVIAGTKEPKRVGLQAGIGGGLSMGLQATIPLLGRMSGLDPEVALAPVGSPGFAKKLPGRGKPEVALTREINYQAENMPRSQGRQDIDRMIAKHDAAGQFIDGQKVLDAMLGNKVAGSSLEATNANRMLGDDVARLRAEMEMVSSMNRRTPDQMLGAPPVNIPGETIVRPGTTSSMLPGGTEWERVPLPSETGVTPAGYKLVPKTTPPTFYPGTPSTTTNIPDVNIPGVPQQTIPPHLRGVGGTSPPRGAETMQYPLTAEQLDAIIQRSLTRPVQDELQGAGSAAYSGARVGARNSAAQTFYGHLGTGAKEAGQQAHEAMLAKEGLQDMFPVDKRGNPRLASPGRVASVGAEGNMSAELVLQSLRDFDRFNPGANLEQKVLDLAFSRAWGPQKQRTASYIMSMLKMPGASGGASGAQNFIRMLGRMAIRSQGVSGAAARGAAGHMAVDLMEPVEK